MKQKTPIKWLAFINRTQVNTYSSTSTCNSISADGGGNLFIAGAFQSSVVLENGTSTATNTNRDMFVARLDDTSGDSFKTDEDGNTSPQANETKYLYLHRLHLQQRFSRWRRQPVYCWGFYQFISVGERNAYRQQQHPP